MPRRQMQPYSGQDYKTLKEQCLKHGELFTDPEFPPTNNSLAFSGNAPSGIEWKRPGELVSNPKLFVGGASSDDFSQGELGNCWFVAACADIAQEKQLWKKVVPNYTKQEWTEDNKYAGIFHFRFFRMGIWCDVVIDDHLPTRNGKLVYCSSKRGNEFWSALLEKAYAKIFGDYESLRSGHAVDAMVDMMGGVGESLKLSDFNSDTDQKKLFSQILEAYENRSLMSASITGKNYSAEQKLETGLIATHAYSITCVRNVKLGMGLSAFFKRKKIHMVRCRNPWGESEWLGAWSDNSPEWNKVSSDEKKEIGLVKENDGEFWMSFDDFCAHFTDLEICHMINTSAFTIKKSWKENVICSEWKTPQRAGGCFNNETRLENPQFLFDIRDENGEIIVSLEQEDARIWKEYGKKNATIGLTICKADLNRKFRMHNTLEKVATTTFVNTRSNFHRTRLPKGRYLLVPSTFDPGHEGRFMLRVYASKDPLLTELVCDAPKQGGCLGPKYKSAISVKIIKGVGLQSPQKRGGADPYCTVQVGGEQIKTPHVNSSLNPEWNWRGTFYAKKKSPDIIIEVWDHNTVRDKIIGHARIKKKDAAYRDAGLQSVRLCGKGKEAEAPLGRVYVQIEHFSDISRA